MHTCTVPAAAIEGWLDSNSSGEQGFGHLLLEQHGNSDEALIAAFRPYFESAHSDAREHFHRQIGIDLHPDADAPDEVIVYPSSLPPVARRGLFGEVMAGMLTEHYSFVGNHDWSVPVFLFRFHADAEQYLFDLVREPTRRRQIFGRHGSDFLALALDHQGRVHRYLAGEAKWRKVLRPPLVDTLMLGDSVVTEDGTETRDGRGIWGQLNRDVNLPLGIRQIQTILKERAPEQFAAAIFSIDEAILARAGPQLPRTNLVLLCGSAAPRREEGTCFVAFEGKPAEYLAPFDLQVVEMFLSGKGEEFVDRLYDALWSDA